MSKAAKCKIGADMAEAIEQAVHKCVDERLEEVEDEIARKVVSKLNEQDDLHEQLVPDNLFNSLGGP